MTLSPYTAELTFIKQAAKYQYYGKEAKLVCTRMFIKYGMEHVCTCAGCPQKQGH